METKTITLKEYCILAGYDYSTGYVNQELRKGNIFPGMVTAGKFGNSWAITVKMGWYKSKTKEQHEQVIRFKNDQK